MMSINSDIFSILHPGDNSGWRTSGHTGQSAVLLLKGQRYDDGGVWERSIHHHLTHKPLLTIVSREPDRPGKTVW